MNLRRHSPLVLAACLAIATGCGDDPDGPGSPDSAVDGPVDAAASCGQVGVSCGADRGCDELRCYEGSGGGFCAPDRTDCGGFAGAECEDPSHACVVFAGDSLGACLTEQERTCVCARSPDAVQGCSQ